MTVVIWRSVSSPSRLNSDCRNGVANLASPWNSIRAGVGHLGLRAAVDQTDVVVGRRGLVLPHEVQTAGILGVEPVGQFGLPALELAHVPPRRPDADRPRRWSARIPGSPDPKPWRARNRAGSRVPGPVAG